MLSTKSFCLGGNAARSGMYYILLWVWELWRAETPFYSQKEQNLGLGTRVLPIQSCACISHLHLGVNSWGSGLQAY